ncbi:MAG: hypothetical protein HN542_10360 [Flavobacteriales bacterium]|jgi:hypothetical protein|nr:hypothetical protein [Flavobacteriales bacterium]NCG30326.1 hypothetical protein [Bacteroidota bacterium]MBT3964514.1 hypothetical protein [Flavobacteriales bacterium]MBT4705761.1 hypothetical protein [Flavobacteriales bacterium]MBT4930242.1 hypothetical protein [Flavobacteriales bacterium]
MKSLTYILVGVFLTGCATYYQRNVHFQSLVNQGSLDKAESYLEGDKKMKKEKNRVLFLLNMGFINHMQQDFEESNRYFNEADLAIEDFQKNYAREALALITNPEVKPYRVEDFENVMIHYYKAINYLSLRQFESSLVEARRMNLLLDRMNDKYKDHKNRYQADAFAHLIMGISYEASGMINDAFIAYRNAYNVFNGEHGYFGIEVPLQLKKDILRTAAHVGLGSEVAYYEKEFGMKSSPSNNEFGEAIILWQNGMGPVKDEFSIDFIAFDQGNGVVSFRNEELDLSIPYHYDDDSKRDRLLALQFIRVAFPKYLERPIYFNESWIELDGAKFQLELIEDVNAIAFKTLEDRFLREIGVALSRLVLKKLTEIQLEEQHEVLGALATVTNAVTEKADTRNWQTLPHSIHYARIALSQGDTEVILKLKSRDGGFHRAPFTFKGEKGAFFVQPYHNLEHLAAASWDKAATRNVKHN